MKRTLRDRVEFPFFVFSALGLLFCVAGRDPTWWWYGSVYGCAYFYCRAMAYQVKGGEE